MEAAAEYAISEKQLEANRANAQKSTGPRTAEGKRRSALNAVRHGLTAHVSIMSEPDREAAEAFIQPIREELAPVGPVETQYARLFATCQHRLNRIASLEDNLFSLGILEGRADDYDLDHAEIHDAACQAKAYRDHPGAFDRLSVYGQRLHNQADRALKQLQTLQQARKAEAKADLQRAVDLYKLFKMNEQPFDPQQNGFVYSSQEVAAEVQRQYLDSAAEIAKGTRYNRELFEKRDWEMAA